MTQIEFEVDLCASDFLKLLTSNYDELIVNSKKINPSNESEGGKQLSFEVLKQAARDALKKTIESALMVGEFVGLDPVLVATDLLSKYETVNSCLDTLMSIWDQYIFTANLFHFILEFKGDLTIEGVNWSEINMVFKEKETTWGVLVI